jgi:hypothetical protein
MEGIWIDLIIASSLIALLSGVGLFTKAKKVVTVMSNQKWKIYIYFHYVLLKLVEKKDKY